VCGVASLFILRRDSQTALPNFSVGQLSARKIWLLHGRPTITGNVSGVCDGGDY